MELYRGIVLGNEYMTATVVARLTGVSRETVRLWAMEGKLPYVRTPYARLFHVADVERLIQQREKENQETETTAQ